MDMKSRFVDEGRKRKRPTANGDELTRESETTIGSLQLPQSLLRIRSRERGSAVRR